MSENKNRSHSETLERYCHIIGRNTAVNCTTSGGDTVYECMNKHECEKNGGCKNGKFCKCKKQQ